MTDPISEAGADTGELREFPSATRRFLAEAGRLGLVVEPVVYPDGTKTAADAAAAIGCDVSAIAKSMLFIAGDDPVLVLMSGDLRVDPAKVAEGHGVAYARRATLDEVREHTGYAAGGTPPVGHPAPLVVYADESLRRNEQVWAAAGTPTTVFPIGSDHLVEVAGAKWADVAER